MKKKNNPFSHLLKDENTTPPEITSNAKKLTFLLFAVFLLLYPKYAPYNAMSNVYPSITQQIFTLYFFVTDQALGIVHEAGHGVCYILRCPAFITASNGTVFQIAFPLGIAYYYKSKGNIFAFYIGLFFVGFSLDYTAWYISTAHEGPIVPAAKSFLGVDAYHDFYSILNTLGLLAYEKLISGLTKALAYGLMILSVFGMSIEAFRSAQK